MKRKQVKSDDLTNLLGLYLLIGLVVLAASIYFVIKPQFALSTVHLQERKAVEAKIAGLEQLERDTEVLKENYEKVADRREEVLAQLPVESEEQRLMVMLNDLAQRNGVALNSFSPAIAEGENATSLAVYPSTIGISGTFPNIENFLRSIESSARFLDVQSGNFAAMGQGAGIEAKVDLTAYYQAQQVSEGAQ